MKDKESETNRNLPCTTSLPMHPAIDTTEPGRNQELLNLDFPSRLQGPKYVGHYFPRVHIYRKLTLEAEMGLNPGTVIWMP